MVVPDVMWQFHAAGMRMALKPAAFTALISVCVVAGLPQAVELWAACGVGPRAEPARAGADRILFDNRGGGTGRPFDWSLLKGHQGLRSAFLAGGVGPSNARAAAGIGVHGLDVGSSIEARPGIKDPAKVEALFAALEKGDLDLVVTEVADDSPWLTEVAVIDPLSRRRVGERLLGLSPVARNGENRWVALLERQQRDMQAGS